MTINGQQISPLISSLHAFLRNHTENPEDGMTVLANLIAFMYHRYATLEDGTKVPLETALSQLNVEIARIVALNDGAPIAETIQ